jgi:hypothetical protein
MAEQQFQVGQQRATALEDILARLQQQHGHGKKSRKTKKSKK